jgi:uncharacterized membrane protein YfcA/glyoxylase-like metal-dependent hydrolase (beta-lactamase superfamily II)/rhodanese-related sulfurtransferase
MTPVFAAGLALSAAIGLSLGLIGGGGSILTVPILVYFLGVPAHEAVPMSLGVVGATSLFGSVLHHRSDNVAVPSGLLFGGTGIVGAFLGAPLTVLVSPPVLLLIFGGLMVAVAVSMIWRSGQTGDARGHAPRPFRAMLAGLGVGILTGFLGVGGGFLIVPALVLFGGLPLKKAIGTSLLVILRRRACRPLEQELFRLGAGGRRHRPGPDRCFGWDAAVGPAVGTSIADIIRSSGFGRWSFSDCEKLRSHLRRMTKLTHYSGEKKMRFRQFYLGCLSHASYYLSSDGEAAVIDPQRDIQQYLDEAEANGDKIRYVIETHSHADFVSGHLELAKHTGAQIVFGQWANTEFETLKVRDGDELALGSINLSFLETPGHTPEGITVLAKDTQNPAEPWKMFTGDTLFIGDVGRPDLVGSKGFTAEQMASMLYDSLHEKILPLPDETIVYPAHGAGSLCGKSLSSETFSTLGEQRRTNYALRPMTRDEFIRVVAADQPEVPAYFPISASQNLKGSASLGELPKPERLTSEQIVAFDGVVVDVRPGVEYGAGHVPNSINIGLGGQFASWAGTLIPVGTPIAIVAATGEQVDEAVIRLARVGEESVKGFILFDDFDGGMRAVPQVPVSDAAASLRDGAQFVDVRRPAEYAGGHAVQTVNIPLDRLPRDFDKLDPALPTFVICQSGYRSSLGTSILENAGFREVYNIAGGTKAWMEAGLPNEV